MSRRDHVGPGGMDLRVDSEGGLVDDPSALHDLAAVVDKAQVGRPDMPEVHAERIDRHIAQLRALKADLTALLNRWHRAPKQNGKVGHICPRIETYSALQEKHNATKKGGEKR